MSNNVTPGNISASLDDANVKTFLETNFPNNKASMIPQSKNILPPGNCYWNVERLVTQFGGSTCFGWLITTWPGVYVEAMHHAVWRMPDERLVDVSESYPLCRTYKSLFVIDNEHAIDFDRLPHITSVHQNLSDLKIVDDHITLYRQLNELERKAADLAHRMGYRCEAQRAIAYRQHPPASNLKPSSQLDMDELQSLSTSIVEAKRRLGSSISDLNAIFGGCPQSG